ncbi:MAG: flagellar basal body-associated FliL family protein [bacterium]|nr:flagellar basal body-associated FliL family protein [bacterium]
MTIDESINSDEHSSTVGKGGLNIIIIILIAFISGAAGGFLTVKILPGEKTTLTNKTPPNKGSEIKNNGNTAAPKNEKNVTTGNIPENPIDPQGTDGEEKTSTPGLLELEKFVTNLPDPFGQRYIEVEFKLVISDKELVPLIKSNKMLMTKLRHDIHNILASRTYKDLKGLSGKVALFEEVMMRGNELIKEALEVEPITKVLHTIWKMQ